jgi:hypothetical protein
MRHQVMKGCIRGAFFLYATPSHWVCIIYDHHLRLLVARGGDGATRGAPRVERPLRLRLRGSLLARNTT